MAETFNVAVWRTVIKKLSDTLAAFGVPPFPSQSPDTIAVLLWAREVLQNHLTTTYAVTDPKGIEELKPVNIGGVDQWLHIRGRNKDNPVLLYLHGGPGFSMLGLMDAIQRPWEDYFTVVHWDQRQTNKSYNPAAGDNSSFTIKQCIDDTEEVIEYLRDYLKKDKLFLIGHSWGSILGMHMVKHHPDALHAYIGIGQVVTMRVGELLLYERLMNHAKEKKEDELVSKLQNIMPTLAIDYPEGEKNWIESCLYVRKELSRLAGETLMHNLYWDTSENMFNFDRLISPHLTLDNLSNLIQGDHAELAPIRSPYLFTKEFLDVDLPNDVGCEFEVPIFHFSGIHDWQIPRVLSDKWFDQIKAPYKELIHFEESCHLLVNEEPGKVLMALVNKVLPWAQGSKGRETDYV